MKLNKKDRKILTIIMTFFFMINLTSCEDLLKNLLDDDDEDDEIEYPEEIEDTEFTEDNVNPEYVDVYNSDTRVISADLEWGNITLENNEVTSSLQPGSVFIMNDEYNNAIRVVTEVEIAGDVINLSTKEGDLCDIFSDVTFTLTTQNVTRAEKGTVLRPEKIIFTKEDGTRIEEAFPARASENVGFTENLWRGNAESLGIKPQDLVIYENDNCKVYFPDIDIDMSLDLTAQLSFGGRDIEEIINNGVIQYRSQALAASFKFIGKVSMKHILEADAWGEAKYKEKEDELVKHNVFPSASLYFMTPAGVPVSLTIAADLFRGASINAEGEIKAYTGIENNLEVTSGILWSQKSGAFLINEVNKNTNLIPPTVEGKGSIDARAWIYPRFHVSLYGVIGPSFDLIPYIGTELSGGFKMNLFNPSGEENYATWQLRGYAGVDAAANISLRFMNYDLYTVPIKRTNALEFDIFNSPAKISLVSSGYPEPMLNTTNHVIFKVSDSTIFGERDTFLPHIVKFSADGSLDKIYGIVDGNGLVSVDWIPADENDVLKAILYASDGSIIAYDNFGGQKGEINKCVTEMDPWVKISYNSFGRISKIREESLERTTTFRYNDKFEVSKIDLYYDDEYEGDEHAELYNLNFSNEDKRLLSCTVRDTYDGEITRATFAYDSSTHLTQMTDGFGSILNLTWDDSGNLIEVNWFDGESWEKNIYYYKDEDKYINHHLQWTVCVMTYFGNFALNNLVGSAPMHLPYRVKVISDEVGEINIDLSYEFDSNNYITKETYSFMGMKMGIPYSYIDQTVTRAGEIPDLNMLPFPRHKLFKK